MNDLDPQETLEWIEAMEAVIERDGFERAQFLQELEQHLHRAAVAARRRNLEARVAIGVLGPKRDAAVAQRPPQRVHRTTLPVLLTARLLPLQRYPSVYFALGRYNMNEYDD